MLEFLSSNSAIKKHPGLVFPRNVQHFVLSICRSSVVRCKGIISKEAVWMAWEKKKNIFFSSWDSEQ